MSTVVLISAFAEWRVVRTLLPEASLQESPYGEWFEVEVAVDDAPTPIVFLHGGWGKIAAAASTQYAIDRWSPSLLVNLGTCGGFAGHVAKGEVVLAERTLVHDIIERMGDPDEAIGWYATDIDLSWLTHGPTRVRRGLLVSADGDLDPAGIEWLHATYGAVAGDWESGAIAWVAARNGVRCLILRGVSDIVSPAGGEAYGDALQAFTAGADVVMCDLLAALPTWLAVAARG
jgi:adenosylhomocysteine nucleosidase